MISEDDARKILIILSSTRPDDKRSSSTDRDKEIGSEREVVQDHEDNTDSKPTHSSNSADSTSKYQQLEAISNTKDDRGKGSAKDENDKDERKSNNFRRYDDSEHVIDEPPTGFRIEFDKRFHSLKEKAKELYGLEEKDFPKYNGKPAKSYDDDQVESDDRPQDQIDADIKNLESMLEELTESYNKLVDNDSDYMDEEDLRKRIHDCKRKLHMLKKRKSQAK